MNFDAFLPEIMRIMITEVDDNSIMMRAGDDASAVDSRKILGLGFTDNMFSFETCFERTSVTGDMSNSNVDSVEGEVSGAVK